MLKVDKLCFAYKKDIILKDVTFCLEQGEALAVIGANGSGKSTLLSLLCGVLKPTSGTIDTGGAKIGLVPQGCSVFEDMTVLENLRFFCGLAGKKVPQQLPFGLDRYAEKKASQLSGGYERKLNIACSFPMQPDIWLFDEPCANLDRESTAEIIEMISGFKRAGKTIIYVGHDEKEYEKLCGKVLKISDARAFFVSKGEYI